MTYYNEIDPFCCAWLRNLMAEGLIPQGTIDERSITDVRPGDLEGFVQCHFFAGIGGWPLALRLAGWPDDEPIWTGSCPCQPFSAAGKGKGHADERHLWPSMFSLIRECRPVRVIGEQVEAAVGLGWLDRVFTDLEAESYTCGATVLGAHSAGTPHIRQRICWLAYAAGLRPERKDWPKQQECGSGTTSFAHRCRDGKLRRIPTEPAFFPLAHGIPRKGGELRAWLESMGVDSATAKRLIAVAGRYRTGSLRCYGNAIAVPLAAEFIKAVMAL